MCEFGASLLSSSSLSTGQSQLVSGSAFRPFQIARSQAAARPLEALQIVWQFYEVRLYLKLFGVSRSSIESISHWQKQVQEQGGHIHWSSLLTGRGGGQYLFLSIELSLLGISLIQIYYLKPTHCQPVRGLANTVTFIARRAHSQSVQVPTPKAIYFNWNL